MFLNLAIINCVIVKCQLTLPSVMVLINWFLDGPIGITEDSGECGEWQHSGLVSDTGCLPFISEF